MATEDKRVTIEITLSSFVKATLFILLIVGLYAIRDVVAIVLLSVVIASAIEPLASWLEKRSIPRVISVIFIYLAVFSIFGFLAYLIIPIFSGEIANFASQVPIYLSDLNHWPVLTSLFPSLSDSSSVISELLQRTESQVAGFASKFLSATANIFGGVMSFILIIVLSFYLSVQKHGLENFLRIVTPLQYESYVLDLWRRTRDRIGKWLQGQILLGVLVGVMVFLGLTILRVEYALTFAFLAAVLEIIPIFGPILAAVPPVAITFFQSPTSALIVAILYIVIQQFENHLIYPLVVRKIIGVPALLAILAIIIGGKLGGFFGIVLAVPVATALKEFLDDVTAKKKLSAK
ncbi:MAG: AI-2E family transporter [bacterium]|nr:AI-2E family transporter [bacterium]